MDYTKPKQKQLIISRTFNKREVLQQETDVCSLVITCYTGWNINSALTTIQYLGSPNPLPGIYLNNVYLTFYLHIYKHVHNSFQTSYTMLRIVARHRMSKLLTTSSR